MSSRRSDEKHRQERNKRHLRFADGVYGVVQDPVIVKDPGFYCAAPSLSELYNTTARQYLRDHWNILKPRCFFSGVRLEFTNAYIGPLGAPWHPTKDHLIPTRRGIDGPKLKSPKVLSAFVVNNALGLSPLAVRLKIRQWLENTSYDRNDNSLDAGLNMRWIIINMLNEFRIHGRFPWSRNSSGQFWNPGISEPFMKSMYKIEREFSELSSKDKVKFIDEFYWNW